MENPCHHLISLSELKNIRLMHLLHNIVHYHATFPGFVITYGAGCSTDFMWNQYTL